MSRFTLLTTVLVVVGFVAGMAVGASFSSPVRDTPVVKATSAVVTMGSPVPYLSDRDPQEAEERAQIADLERQVAELKAGQDAAILQDRIAFCKKYGMGLRPYDGDLKISQGMAEFLKMSPEEKKAVEDHLAQIRAQILSLQKQNLKLVKQTDNSVSYEIEPFPEGAALKDQLKQQMEGDLGTDRADLFLKASDWEERQQFAEFGTGKIGLEVTRVDQSGTPAYRFRQFGDTWSALQDSVNSVPPQFSGLIQLDPTP